MKKIVLLLFAIATLFSITACGGGKTDEEIRHETYYCESITAPSAGIHKATITDANVLIIAVDAYPGTNFDAFAKTYLNDAIKNGVNIKACMIVDAKNCQFQKGAVVGKRIGKAFR